MASLGNWNLYFWMENNLFAKSKSRRNFMVREVSLGREWTAGGGVFGSHYGGCRPHTRPSLLPQSCLSVRRHSPSPRLSQHLENNPCFCPSPPHPQYYLISESQKYMYLYILSLNYSLPSIRTSLFILSAIFVCVCLLRAIRVWQHGGGQGCKLCPVPWHPQRLIQYLRTVGIP